MATANRGKVAEGLVRKHLASVNRQDFAWSRLPDAHAGSFQPALADFLLLNAGQMVLLEVKETQHDYRLPVGNFSPDSRARMRLFQLAGAKCQVLIFHSSIKLWRTAELDYFGTQTTGSWDMRELPLLTLREALC